MISKIRSTLSNKSRHFCLASGTVLALYGCVSQPVSEDGKTRLEVESAQLATRIEQSIGVVDDPKLHAYVESIGTRVSANSKRQNVAFQFQVLDMSAPNAMALPSGHIYISRGLLVLANSEDEIAGVLAHEVAHVEREHAQGRSSVAVATSPIRIITGIAGSATGLIAPSVGDAITGIGDAATGVVMAPYSREQEREADAVGQRLAAGEGYDPAALPDILDTMGKFEALAPEGARKQSWFDTHPATSERVSLTRDYAATLTAAPRQPVGKDRAELFRKLDGLVIGENPAKGIFKENLFIHPRLRFLMEFPRGWETVNRGRLVAAQSKEKSDFLMLMMVAKGDDPMLGARMASGKFEADLASGAQRGRINGLPAATNRAKVGEGNKTKILDLTWIAHAGLVYQVIGLTALERHDVVGETMAKSAQSFRGLSAAEASQIQVVRLKVVAAEQGESLSQLARRVDSVWSVEELAAANRKSSDESLKAGDLIKAAVIEPYEARK